MKKYIVWVSWEVGNFMEIEAESEGEARLIAIKSSELPQEGAEYVEDSFRVNDVELAKDE